jgi:hypothetical protein
LRPRQAVRVVRLRSVSAVTTGWPVEDRRRMPPLGEQISVAPRARPMRESAPVAVMDEEGAMLMMIGMSYLMSGPSYLGSIQPRH